MLEMILRAFDQGVCVLGKIQEHCIRIALLCLPSCAFEAFLYWQGYPFVPGCFVTAFCTAFCLLLWATFCKQSLKLAILFFVLGLLSFLGCQFCAWQYENRHEGGVLRIEFNGETSD